MRSRPLYCSSESRPLPLILTASVGSERQRERSQTSDADLNCPPPIGIQNAGDQDIIEVEKGGTNPTDLTKARLEVKEKERNKRPESLRQRPPTNSWCPAKELFYKIRALSVRFSFQKELDWRRSGNPEDRYPAAFLPRSPHGSKGRDAGAYGQAVGITVELVNYITK
ncbi:hypothetical protein CMUS01_04391 [Colletotrichum musicola]|uniref:Uncharacterized protein n=1 Tax=Colletotrichum musicola TaxID=2175873 RepID=A0A8H6KWW0_9PEZI|nr:hypothetical protein CMUS01_04391 [Colletotrichum musicola]